MAWSWLSRLFGAPAPRAERRRARGTPTLNVRPRVLQLEDRVTPAVNIVQAFPGLSFQNTFDKTFATQPDYEIPADPSIAVGPTRIMQVVDSTIAIMDKHGNVLSQANLFDFFFPILPLGAANLNPTVVYDDLAQRFYFFMITNNGAASQVFYAIFSNSTPNFLVPTFTPNGPVPSDIIEGGQITTAFTSVTNGVLELQDLKVGYNREAVFLTNNLVGAANGIFDHSQILTIQKSSLFDFKPGGAFIPATGQGIIAFNTDLSNLDYGPVPARMHDAAPGTPMYFVSTVGIGQNNTPSSNTAIRIIKMTRFLGLRPVIEFSQYTVSPYGNGPLPNAAQPDDVLNIGDTRFTSVAWRGNHLVATQTAKIRNTDSVVRWYDWDTTTKKPTMLQSGRIDGGNGYSTFFPSVEISAKGDIGIIYNQSGPTQFLSIYLAGRAVSDPRGYLQAPVPLFAGQATYKDSAGRPYIPGTVSSIAFDPASPSTFYATAMYASGTRTLNNWATFVGQFYVGPLVASPLKLLGPIRWTYDPTSNSVSGVVVFMNMAPTMNGTLVFVLTPTDPNTIFYAPAGLRIGNRYFVAMTGVFAQNQVLRFPITLRTANRGSLGSLFISYFTGIV